MIIFENRSKDFLVEKLDPRCRILIVFAFALLVCLTEKAWVLWTTLGFSIFLVFLTKASLKRMMKRLKAVNGFMLVLLLLLPLFIKGNGFLYIGKLVWSYEGFLKVGLMILKSNSIMILVTVLLGAMEPVYFAVGLRGLGVPQRLNLLLLFMIRYIEVIHQEYHRLRHAIKLRGFQPTCSLHTFKTIGNLIGVLLLRSLKRSERVLEAMKCRGFKDTFPLLKPLSITRHDVVFALICFSIILLLGGCSLL